MDMNLIVRLLFGLAIAVTSLGSSDSHAAFISVYRGGICVANSSGACIGGDIREETGLGARVGFIQTTSGSGLVAVYPSTCYSGSNGICTARGLSLDVNGAAVGYLSTTAPDSQSANAPLIQSNGLLLQGLTGTASGYLWTRQIAVTAVNNGTSPTAGAAFSVIVQIQDASGAPVNVSAATSVSLSVKPGTGTGTLGGTLTGTIPLGSNQITISGVTYTKAEIGVVINAARTSGDNLATGESKPFTVNPGAAAKLGFITQPGNTPTGISLSGPPTLAVQDGLGNTITSSSAAITVAIGTNPGGGTLSGTTTRNAVAGVATFTGLSINQLGNGYTLTATSTGLTSATSSGFNITGSGTIAGTITRSSDSSPVGGVLVEALPASGVARSTTSAANGSYSLANLGVGTYSVRASAGGYTTLTQTGVSVTAGSTTTTNLSLVASGAAPGVVYGYDELGRLRGVVSPSGEAARYAYDAVGNTTSITRYDSTQVSVVEFSPNSGSVGSTVMIYGTGFSTTPYQNSVTFNGVPAFITSATNTQIAVTVPTGATTGPISASTSVGTATSNETFTVLSATNAPTITGFSAPAVAVGSTVTISGTNFQTPATANAVRFSGIWAVPSTATSTSIGVTVPATANSGKVNVTTGFGTAISPSDLFIVRSPMVPADVVQTGRMTIDGAVYNVNIPTAGKVSLVVFDALAGQSVGFGINASNTVAHSVEVRGPQGNIIMPNAGLNRDSNVNLFLPSAGTYSITITASSSPANIDLTLSTDFNAGTIVADGLPAVPITISRVGQRGYLIFSGTAGQNLGIGANSNSSGMDDSKLSVYGPTGNVVASRDSFSAGGPNNFYNNVHLTLPAMGDYKILLDPIGSRTGTVTFSLSSQIEAGSITTTDPALSLSTTISRVGQRARVTFSGTAGQNLSLGFNQVLISNDVETSIYAPTGVGIDSTSLTSTATNFHLMNLPATGEYSIYVDPIGINTTTAAMTLSQEIDAGTLMINGASVPVSVSRVGQRARFVFSGNSGQQVTVRTSNYTINTAPYVSLARQNGDLLAVQIANPPSFNLTPVTLPAADTYYVYVDPAGTETAGLNVAVTSP